MRKTISKKTTKNGETTVSSMNNNVTAHPSSDYTRIPSLPTYKGLEITKMQKTIGNQAVAQLIKEMRTQYNQPIQRKITIEGSSQQNEKQEYSSVTGNLGELEEIIHQKIQGGEVFQKYGISIAQILTRYDFRNRSFANIENLIDTILSEIRESVKNSPSNSQQEEDHPNIIPKYLHHFWAGGSLSDAALTNLFEWLGKANENGWTQYIMTDSIINSNKRFADSKLEYQLELLRAGGAAVVDMAQLPLHLGETEENENPISTAYKHLRDKLLPIEGNSKLPYISDLARYVQLFNLGGVYADVDINPGNVDLSHSLQMPEETGMVPFLGPGFRTEDDARRKGLFDEKPGGRESALLSMFVNNNGIGNHFIGTRASNPLIRTVAGITAKNVLNAGVSNGGIDVLKGFHESNMDLDKSVAQSIPPWLMDVDWVTPESNSIVD